MAKLAPYQGLTRLLGTIVIAASLLGLAYAWSEYKVSGGNIPDWPFILLLTLNNFVMLIATSTNLKRISEYAQLLTNDANRLQEHAAVNRFYGWIPRKRLLTLGGLAFGGLFFAYVFLWAGLKDEPMLTLTLLGAYLGTSNVVTGICICILLLILRLFFQLGKFTRIDLWDKSCPGSAFIVKYTGRIAIVVALVSTSAILSTYFSKFTFGSTLIIGFISWSLLVPAATFVIPLVPLSRRLARRKQEAISSLGLALQTKFDAARRDLEGQVKIDISNLEILQKLLRETRAVQVFPPIGARRLQTAAYFSLITALPVTIQVFAFFQSVLK